MVEGDWFESPTAVCQCREAGRTIPAAPALQTRDCTDGAPESATIVTEKCGLAMGSRSVGVLMHESHISQVAAHLGNKTILVDLGRRRGATDRRLGGDVDDADYHHDLL
jgi:hypothetical protein